MFSLVFFISIVGALICLLIFLKTKLNFHSDFNKFKERIQATKFDITPFTENDNLLTYVIYYRNNSFRIANVAINNYSTSIINDDIYYVNQKVKYDENAQLYVPYNDYPSASSPQNYQLKLQETDSQIKLFQFENEIASWNKNKDIYLPVSLYPLKFQINPNLNPCLNVEENSYVSPVYKKDYFLWVKQVEFKGSDEEAKEILPNTRWRCNPPDDIYNFIYPQIEITNVVDRFAFSFSS